MMERSRIILSDEGLRDLLETRDTTLVESLHKAAAESSRERFGREIYLRGLVEWSNVCRNDCLYCGIRRSNGGVRRYSLSAEEILSCCQSIYDAGIRTVVLQGGENPAGAEALVPVVAEIRRRWPSMAITLSLGELPFGLYKKLKESGADRYLLRHETASPEHYTRLHPEGMVLESRLACLRELRRLGYQVGMGMMVGSPFQTVENLIGDLRLMQEFQPEMIGIGPFIPQADTPLGIHPAGSAETTLRLISILRLMLPDALIPATTALATIAPEGRLKGILAGANVIMPGFTPPALREEYKLYNHKAYEDLETIKTQLASIGYSTSTSRGDFCKH